MLFRAATVTLALLFAPAPLLAQAVVQPLGVSDADALAEQVRRLGANPLDLDALLTAAELSLRLEDLSAAGSFLARAEKIAPVSARGQAIKGAILVRSERPGEALRQFGQAEAMGLATVRFAADRGLAYDLVGDQLRAQRDYRQALGGGGTDETRRRYALSLAISGKQREALDELAPLVRRNDRAAWRTRAFVLAMGGQPDEALKIAQTMMPPGSAQGLRTFFAELPRLSVVDRAFAVHFGEVRATPARLADARLAPQLAPLPVEPAPVQVAVVTTPTPAPRERGRRRKEKVHVGRVTLATAAPTPTLAAAEALPAPPAYQAPAYQPAPYRPPVVLAANTADRPLTPGEQASLAAATLRPARSRSRTAPPVATAPAPALSPAERASLAAAAGSTVGAERPVVLAAATPPPLVRAAPTPVPSAMPAASSSAPAPSPAFARPPSTSVSIATTMPLPAIGAATSQTVAALAATPVPTAAPTPVGGAPIVPDVLAISTPPVARPDATPLVSDASSGNVTSLAIVAAPPTAAPDANAPAVASVAPAPAAVTSTPLAPLVTPPPAQVAARPVQRPARIGRAQADDILAKIVANLSIPAAELGVAKPTAGARRTRASERLATADAAKDAKPESSAKEKRAAEQKALADKKAAADKKALADKAAAEKKAARGEPSRIWVQVAGGANDGDLAKAWKAVRAKAPGALAGRQGYTAPLRATNRVLTGPFKTDAEARAYVNQLAKSGVSAFPFTSDAGQKISRLDAK